MAASSWTEAGRRGRVSLVIAGLAPAIQ